MPHSITCSKGARVSILSFWHEWLGFGASLSSLIMSGFHFTEIEMVVSCLIFFLICYLREFHIGTFHFGGHSKRWTFWSYPGDYQQVNSDTVGPEIGSRCKGVVSRGQQSFVEKGSWLLRIFITRGNTMSSSKVSNLYSVKWTVTKHRDYTSVRWASQVDQW